MWCVITAQQPCDHARSVCAWHACARTQMVSRTAHARQRLTPRADSPPLDVAWWCRAQVWNAQPPPEDVWRRGVWRPCVVQWHVWLRAAWRAEVVVVRCGASQSVCVLATEHVVGAHSPTTMRSHKSRARLACVCAHTDGLSHSTHTAAAHPAGRQPATRCGAVLPCTGVECPAAARRCVEPRCAAAVCSARAHVVADGVAR